MAYVGTGIPVETGFDNYSPKPFDLKYGPWNSTADALAGIDANNRHLGLTIGVVVSGKIVEYWWRDNTDNAGLIAKNPENTSQEGTEIQTALIAPDADGQTEFDLSEIISENGTVQDLYLNGILQIQNIDYSYSEQTITWLDEELELKTWHFILIKHT